MSERLIVRHLIAALELVRIEDTDRRAILTSLRQARPGQAAIIRERAKALRDLEARRRHVEDGVADGVIRKHRAKEMHEEIDRREREIPPPPVENISVEADLSLLEGLPEIIARARAGWPDEKDVVRAANAILREVVERIEWPERLVKYRPRVVFAPRYAAIISSVAEARAAGDASATAIRKRAISPASGESARVANGSSADVATATSAPVSER